MSRRSPQIPLVATATASAAAGAALPHAIQESLMYPVTGSKFLLPPLQKKTHNSPEPHRSDGAIRKALSSRSGAYNGRQK